MLKCVLPLRCRRRHTASAPFQPLRRNGHCWLFLSDESDRSPPQRTGEVAHCSVVKEPRLRQGRGHWSLLTQTPALAVRFRNCLAISFPKLRALHFRLSSGRSAMISRPPGRDKTAQPTIRTPPSADTRTLCPCSPKCRRGPGSIPSQSTRRANRRLPTRMMAPTRRSLANSMPSTISSSIRTAP